MPGFLSLIGRVAGYAVKTHILEKAAEKTKKYVFSEMKLSDIRLKISLLKRKRQRHISILGRTVYRLTINDIAPFENTQVQSLINIIQNIDYEIINAMNELERRKEEIKKNQAEK